jgi:RNA-binding protein
LPSARKDLFPGAAAKIRRFFLASAFFDFTGVQSAAMKLTETQKKFLRGLGHQLKPVIMIGEAGLSDSVFNEFCSTIEHHELIKVRVRAGDRKTRDSIIDELCKKGSAELVTRIGNVALLYRRNEEKPRIPLPL